jgi:hypothetical protein
LPSCSTRGSRGAFGEAPELLDGRLHPFHLTPQNLEAFGVLRVRGDARHQGSEPFDRGQRIFELVGNLGRERGHLACVRAMFSERVVARRKDVGENPFVAMSEDPPRPRRHEKEDHHRDGDGEDVDGIGRGARLATPEDGPEIGESRARLKRRENEEHADLGDGQDPGLGPAQHRAANDPREDEHWQERAVDATRRDERDRLNDEGPDEGRDPSSLPALTHGPELVSEENERTCKRHAQGQGPPARTRIEQARSREQRHDRGRHRQPHVREPANRLAWLRVEDPTALDTCTFG